jgi:hypothetical protein
MLQRSITVDMETQRQLTPQESLGISTAMTLSLLHRTCLPSTVVNQSWASVIPWVAHRY